jgi:hypothetical protein
VQAGENVTSKFLYLLAAADCAGMRTEKGVKRQDPPLTVPWAAVISHLRIQIHYLLERSSGFFLLA